jgi:hypothetical protein
VKATVAPVERGGGREEGEGLGLASARRERSRGWGVGVGGVRTGRRVRRRRRRRRRVLAEMQSRHETYRQSRSRSFRREGTQKDWKEETSTGLTLHSQPQPTTFLSSSLHHSFACSGSLPEERSSLQGAGRTRLRRECGRPICTRGI